MSESQPLFSTSRNRVLRELQDAGLLFQANTKPYKSTLPFQFDIVDAAPSPNPTTAMAICRKGQRIELFAYGVGDSIPYAPGLAVNRAATEADTNLSKGRRTNGVEDMVIEGVSLTHKCTRVEYLAAAAGALVADPVDILCYRGQAALYDPGAVVAPPQCNSPANLEDPLWNGIAPHLAVEFEFDRTRVVKIGTCDEIPEGGAKSFLRSNGDPRTDNRYKVPEGMIWRRQGLPDSEFVMRITVADDICIPLNLVTLPQGTTPAVPQRIYIDITGRLHGMALAGISKN